MQFKGCTCHSTLCKEFHVYGETLYTHCHHPSCENSWATTSQVSTDEHRKLNRIHVGRNLTNAEFVYLSACHTAVGDEESPDEVIHLASAMQFAGFRSVIGTMWQVDDAETNKIVPLFYKHRVDESGCLDHTRAAFALWETMRSLKSGTSGKVPLDQRVLYVHIGA